MARLFRKQFLLDLQRNDDELELVVPRRYLPVFWLMVSTVSVLLAALATWGFTARIPVHVSAQGMVLPLGGVREVVSFGQGQIVARPGGDRRFYQAGDMLLRISHPTSAAAYDDARKKYLEEKAVLTNERISAREKYANRQKNLSIQLENVRDKISMLTTIARDFENAIANYRQAEESLLNAQQDATASLKESYDELVEGLRELREKRFTSARDLTQFEQGRTSALVSLSDIAINISRAPVELQRLLREHGEIRERIAAGLAREKELIGERREARNAYAVELSQLTLREVESRNTLLDAERKLWMISNLFAPYDGNLVAMKKAIGQTVAENEPVALFNMAPQRLKLMLVLSPRAVRGSLSLAWGGNKVRVSLAGGQIDAFRKDLGEALSRLIPQMRFDIAGSEERIIIIPHQDDAAIPGNLRLAELKLLDSEALPAFAILLVVGDEWQSSDLTTVALLQPEDAKRVRPGHRALVKPDYESTLIGTRLEARVASVSDYVATSLEAQALIGSAEIAGIVSDDKAAVPAVLRFERDETGDLKRRGGELDVPLSIGTTATVRIHVKTAAPITILLPFLIDLFR